MHWWMAYRFFYVCVTDTQYHSFIHCIAFEVEHPDYKEAKAPIPSKDTGLLTTMRTGYFHSINFVHPVCAS